MTCWICRISPFIREDVVLPDRRYVVRVDLSPEGWFATATRLNGVIVLLHAEWRRGRVAEYRLELHDVRTAEHVLTWPWSEEP